MLSLTPTTIASGASIAGVSEHLALSVVVITYDMEREIPRTLRSLAPPYQRGIDPSDYEVVVIDNGSPRPLDERILSAFPGRLRSARLQPASPSPAHAANVGLDMAKGSVIGLLIDGARMASPGLLAQALTAARAADRPIVATLAWHLGPVTHMRAPEVGYNRETEDRLLDDAGWESDGYRLFEVSTLAGSSGHGWFGPLDETNAIFMPRPMWTELDGLDEQFTLPGGGALNYDLFRRAGALDGSRLILLLGEGTFHQIHGGSLTSGTYPKDWALAEYERIRGTPLPPPPFDPLYVGTIPPSTLRHLDYSVHWALNRQRHSVTRNETKSSSSGIHPD
jgi:glycosyltransferase involved in cell wall biosynthesis